MVSPTLSVIIVIIIIIITIISDSIINITSNYQIYGQAETTYLQFNNANVTANACDGLYINISKHYSTVIVIF